MKEIGSKGASLPPSPDDHYMDEQGVTWFVMSCENEHHIPVRCMIGTDQWSDVKTYTVEEFERAAANWEYRGYRNHNQPPTSR